MALIEEGLVTEEVAYSTGLSGSSLTIPLANRGLEGTSAAIHANSGSVKGILTVGMWNDLITALLNSHVQSTGVLDTTKVVDLTTAQALTNKTLTSPILTTPKITTSINDSSGNEVIKTPATASAVNEITVTNGATGSSPIISATGDDSNLDIVLTPKGTGKTKTNTNYGAITTDTDGATITFDASATNRHVVILGGNRTLALSNTTSGQIVILELVQDGTGSRTVTWFVGPALTVTMTLAAPGVITSGQDIPTGTPVVFTTTGALPTGLTASTTYWWTRVSATTGSVSTSFANCQAGTLITTSVSQSGVHTMKTAIRWVSQTAPTLSTGKFTGDIVQIYVRDATAGVYEGLVAGQGI